LIGVQLKFEAIGKGPGTAAIRATHAGITGVGSLTVFGGI
jgi:hypothetical protein